LLETGRAALESAESEEALQSEKVRLLGKKGELTACMKEMRNLPPDERPVIGALTNTVKEELEDLFQRRLELLREQKINEKLRSETIDVTLPGRTAFAGTRHPITLVNEELVDIFSSLGFGVEEGPEIEKDFYNFEALNIPKDHPARDMQDTFFIEQNPDIALRTHTSSVQVRVMENNKPPIRIIAPGRVYRNEAISSRSHCVFHQVEGLYIDKGVTFADMVQTIKYFSQAFFGKAKIRLRPSYFPFTEPSAEVDVYWGLENETDHRITKGTGWLEIMGCGMVDPDVLKASGIDPNEYSGYAFGMGIERIAMNRYQIGDIRMLFENDVRFLSQLKGAW